MFRQHAKLLIKLQSDYKLMQICRYSVLTLRNLTANNCLQNDTSVIYDSKRRNSNLYDALGVKPQSTQNDIKAAYYKLSKIYHPDLNKGCETSASKFRAITHAYEVLGNYKSRRLYDKGVIIGGPVDKPQYEVRQDEPTVEDDDQTKFYKSRFTRSEIKQMGGRSPIYNFDEWSRAHYGNTIKQRQADKMKHDRDVKGKISNKLGSETEIMILFVAVVVIFCCAILNWQSNIDVPKERQIKHIKKTVKIAEIKPTNSSD